MILIKKYHFYAAHRNEEAGIKCGRIHGHTYDIELSFDYSDKSTWSGDAITCLFSDVDSLVEPLIKQYDHYLLLYDKDVLCDVLQLADEPYLKLPFQTSAENLAMWILHEIRNATNLPLVKIKLAETKSSTVEYDIRNK
jgi:6-pyruvoyl-tetrahydropterin synthase